MVGNMLYIDIDYKNVQWEEWTERLCFVLENLNIKPRDIRIFETEKGYHIYVVVWGCIEDWLTVMVQALLGSDYKRETYNLSRLLSGCIFYQTMFRNKEKFRLTELEEHIKNRWSSLEFRGWWNSHRLQL